MSILQFVAAALVMVGSALVLGAVWLADVEDQPVGAAAAGAARGVARRPPDSITVGTIRGLTSGAKLPLLPPTLWCRGPARHPFKVKIEGSNPSRVANPIPG